MAAPLPPPDPNRPLSAISSFAAKKGQSPFAKSQARHSTDKPLTKKMKLPKIPMSMLLNTLRQNEQKQKPIGTQTAVLMDIAAHISHRGALQTHQDVDFLLEHLLPWFEKLVLRSVNDISKALLTLMKHRFFSLENATPAQRAKLEEVKFAVFTAMVNKLATEHPNNFDSTAYHNMLWAAQDFVRVGRLPANFALSVQRIVNSFAQSSIEFTHNHLPFIYSYLANLIENNPQNCADTIVRILPSFFRKMNLTEFPKEIDQLAVLAYSSSKILANTKCFSRVDAASVELCRDIIDLMNKTIVKAEQVYQQIQSMDERHTFRILLHISKMIEMQIPIANPTKLLKRLISIHMQSQQNVSLSSDILEILARMLKTQKQGFELHEELKTIAMHIQQNMQLISWDNIGTNMLAMSKILDVKMHVDSSVYFLLSHLFVRYLEFLNSQTISYKDLLMGLSKLSKLFKRRSLFDIDIPNNHQMMQILKDCYNYSLKALLQHPAEISKFTPYECSTLLKLVDRGRQKNLVSIQTMINVIPLVEHRAVEQLQSITAADLAQFLYCYAAKGALRFDNSPANYELILLSHPLLMKGDFSKFTKGNCEGLLSALLIIMAKRQEYALANDYPADAFNLDILEIVKRLFDHMIKNFTIFPSTINVAARWIGRECIDVRHMEYDEDRLTSASQRGIDDLIRARLAPLPVILEQEVTPELGLTPVDIIIKDTKIIIEVNGAQHYLDQDMKIRTGRTILKRACYERLGYRVYEIPTWGFKLCDPEAFERIIAQLSHLLSPLHTSTPAIRFS